MGARPRQTFEIGKSVEGQIDLSGRAAEFISADPFEKIGGQFACFEKFFKGKVRVDAGGDDVRGNFFAILEGNATSAAVLDENFTNRRFGADFYTGFACGTGDGVRNGTRAARRT